MVVALREITDENRAAVLALRVAPQQERFIDQRYRGRGYGSEAVRQVARLVRAEGARDRLLARKYRVDLLLVKPIRKLQAALRRRRPRGVPVGLEITPS